MGFGQTGLRTTHCQSPQGYAVKKTKMYRLKYKMVFSLDRLKGLIQICVSMRVTSLNCTEHSLSLYKNGLKLEMN